VSDKDIDMALLKTEKTARFLYKFNF
jgi:hypothetical protein